MCYKQTSCVELHFEKKNVFIPRSFLVINVCNEGKTLCSPCTFMKPFKASDLLYAKPALTFRNSVFCLTMNLSVLRGSHNKQRLFLYIPLS